MANWVNGYIVPYGTKKEIDKFTTYINHQEKWKNIINRYCPDVKYMKENEIRIHDNSAMNVIEIAEEMEEKFRCSTFHFFVCDEMNAIGWGINYMNAIETRILYEEKYHEETNEYWLEPTEISSEFITDKHIEERKKERENSKNELF